MGTEIGFLVRKLADTDLSTDLGGIIDTSLLKDLGETLKATRENLK